VLLEFNVFKYLETRSLASASVAAPLENAPLICRSEISSSCAAIGEVILIATEATADGHDSP
jgi:hypothetical protein